MPVRKRKDNIARSNLLQQQVLDVKGGVPDGQIGQHHGANHVGADLWLAHCLGAVRDALDLLQELGGRLLAEVLRPLKVGQSKDNTCLPLSTEGCG